MAAARLASAYQRALPALVTFVLVILVVACLYFARPVLIPLALAILFTFLLSPVVLWLQRRGLPRTPAVILVVIAASIIVASIGWLFVAQVVYLGHELPKYEKNVTERIEELREQGRGGLLAKVQHFLRRVSEAATEPEAAGGPPELPPPRVEVVTPGLDLGPYLSSLAPILEPIATAGLVIVLVIFMLLKREDARNRLLSLIGHGRMVVTTKALDDAGQRIGRYLLAQFFLNVGFGVVIAGGLLVLGVPHALLWGLLAGFLRYIPMLGPWVAAVFPVSMSLLTASGWMQPLLVIALFIAFELVSNLIVEPLVYGQSIGVSQTALMVAIAFWTWLWGPIGLMLAAPLTVCLVILGKYVPQLKFFDVLLGDEPVLTPDMQYYQRLLARDEDEASDLVHEQSKSLSLPQLFDRLFVPALVHTKRDLASDRLGEDDAEFVIQATRDIVEEESFGDLATAQQAAEEESTGEEKAASDQALAKVEILACAADDEADEVALAMFERMLDPKICQLDVLTTSSLVSEVVTRVEQERPAAVLIAALPPGGLAKTRLLCKRLRTRFPDLKIVVGRWGVRANAEGNREQLVAAGANHFATSMEQTAIQVAQLAQFLRPAAKKLRVDDPSPAVPGQSATTVLT